MWGQEGAGGLGPPRLHTGISWTHLKSVSGSPGHDLDVPSLCLSYDTGVSCVYLGEAQYHSGKAGELVGRKFYLRRYFRGRTEVGVV